ncbi:MAG: autotransporter outer membrane beta-barrel domain-containing protein, partial [Duodenibacillus sp.]|nr:autotransporter outer membrane beta-barrel domain-containing protein [Duodenibacillus sp.]
TGAGATLTNGGTVNAQLSNHVNDKSQFVNSGVLNVTAREGQASDLGRLTNDSNGTVNLSGAATGVEIDNQGTFALAMGSSLSGSGGAALEITSSGEGEIVNEGELAAKLTNTGKAVDNRGALTALAGSSLGSLDNALGATLTAAGLVLADSIASAGDVRVSEGSELAVQSFAGGSGRLVNEGVLRAGDGFELGEVSNAASGRITAEGAVSAKSLSNLGAFAVSGGTFSAGSIANEGAFSVNGGSASADSVLNRGAFAVNGGAFTTPAFDNRGELAVNGAAFSAGSLGNTGTVAVSGGALAADALDNQGALRIDLGADGKASLGEVANSGSIVVHASDAAAPGLVTVKKLESNTGTILVAVDGAAVSKLGGGSAGEIAQSAADILQLGAEPGASGYDVLVAGDAITGEISARADASGKVVQAEEKKNPVPETLGRAAAGAFLLMRTQVNDMTKRLGDLRAMPEESGAWARVIAGKAKYRSYSSDYQTLQAGADGRIGNFFIGGTASHTKGDGKMRNGDSDDRLYSFGLYGGWLGEAGQFVDVVVKRGRIRSDFRVRNPSSGARYKGRLDPDVTTVSAEAGWRVALGEGSWFVEPQAELVYGRMGSAKARADGVTLKLGSAGMLIGRVGAAAGWTSPGKKGSAYFRASALKDFRGDVKAEALAGGSSRKVKEEMGGAWGEFALGGTFNFTKSLSAHAELEASTGGKVRSSYRVTGALRYSF